MLDVPGDGVIKQYCWIYSAQTTPLAVVQSYPLVLGEGATT